MSSYLATGPGEAPPVSLDGLDGTQLLALTREAVRRLGVDPLTAAVDDDVLSASVDELHRLETMVFGEKLRRIAELDSRKAYIGKAMSTADWLAPRLGVSRGEAKGQTEAATVLERLPKTARRLRAGELGAGQARQAARSLTELDELTTQGVAVPPDAAAELDDHVDEVGPTKTPGQLRRSLDELNHAHSPDVLAERERRAHANRRVWIGPPGPDGDAPLEGRLDVLGQATVRAALDALSRPTGPNDRRSLGQRRHDALVTLAERSLDAGDLPTVAAQRPHIIVTTTTEGLDGMPDADPSLLDGYGPVSSATARVVACDGEITEVVVDHRGRPLQTKETGRPTRKQRLAVIARDRSCVGCGTPASRCQLHHVRWRRHQGATVVENLVLVCYACHHAIHHDGWTVTADRDGRYALTQPRATGGGAGGRLRHTA